eukprot:188350-Pyramimonas_sp.AAC.1
MTSKPALPWRLTSPPNAWYSRGKRAAADPRRCACRLPYPSTDQQPQAQLCAQKTRHAAELPRPAP